jgi:pyruvate/2-oxoglutarate/acetoin dehydrogenase E1 component
MKVDRMVYILGEGAHVKVHFDAPYIEREFPERIVSWPIAEDSCVNFSLGASLLGVKPVCVKPNTIILGDNMAIADYGVGNHAFGGDGQLSIVTETMTRNYDGPLVNIRARYLTEIVCTPQHPIKIVRQDRLRFQCGDFKPKRIWNLVPEWVPASDVKEGDFLFVPKIHSIRNTSNEIDISSYNLSKNGNGLKKFLLNVETAWLLGLFVAEGSSVVAKGSAYVSISLNALKEMEVANRVKRIVGDLGYSASMNIRGNAMHIHVPCAALARGFRDWCGWHAQNKQVPDFIMTASDEIRRSFMRGLFIGDGSLNIKRKKKNAQMHLVTSSFKLALQVQLLAASLGAMMGISHRPPQSHFLSSEKRVIYSHEGWQVSGSSTNVAKIFGYTDSADRKKEYYIDIGDCILVPTVSVTKETYVGPVYNIATSSQTYLVSNAIVHNCDVITSDFLYRVMDSVCNTCATTNHILGEQAGPIIIRGEFLLFAPSTGQRNEALFAHVPNLNVVVPSNPIDAYYLMQDALGRKEVTVFYEDRMIEDVRTKPDDRLDHNPRSPACKIGEAGVRRNGNRLTVVSYALTAQRTERVLDENGGLDVELIDLRTVKPFDRQTVLNSVKKTRKLLLIEPDIVTGGIGAEVVASVTEATSKLGLDVKVRRIGAPLRTIPASPALHDMFIPNTARIEREIRRMLA